MSILPQSLALIGFGAAFVSFTGVLILVLASHPGTRQAYLLIAALVVSMVWSGSMSYAAWSSGEALLWAPMIDALHVSFWAAFVATLLLGAAENATGRRMGIGILALTGVGLLSVVLAALPSGAGQAQGDEIALLALLGLPLLGLLALEQVWRNAEFGERRVFRPLAIGVGMIFALELFCYSQVFIFEEINVATWQLRGVGNAIAAPFVLVAIKRQRDWERELFLSRHVVFHTASLVAAGIYLLVLGLVGSTIRSFDGTLRGFLEFGLLLSVGAVLWYALFSMTLRRRLKVFIAKHFYRNRYDYRQEWLRLIRTLAGGDAGSSVTEQGVKALAEIIESPRGELWWADAPGQPFQGCGSWGMPAPASSLPADSALVAFLAVSHWVIDTDEYTGNPELYENAFETARDVLERPSVYVPLILDRELSGIVRLDRRPDLGPLGFEDHDLLKTAGKQVAVFLAQERVQARLAETRQFEAFSRLTTFLMHDLKNMISQQELVVGNAQRFKHKPEFVDDAISTIEASVKRMRKVLERLQSHGRGDSSSTIDLGKLLAEVVNGCSDRSPVPGFVAVPAGIHVVANRDKLSMALTHAVRNAQEATGGAGTVEIGCCRIGGRAVIEIRDDGAGMDEDFVRHRLFKPFDSTKGAQGMGIGAYQIQEAFRSAGGAVEVSSEVGRGTTLRLSLPVAARPAAVAGAGTGAVGAPGPSLEHRSSVS